MHPIRISATVAASLPILAVMTATNPDVIVRRIFVTVWVWERLNSRTG